jgi:hypothetical protein
MMTLIPRRFLTIALVAVVATLVLSTVRISAQQQLPPGVTPEYMKFILTPLNAHPAAMPADTKGVLGCIPTMGYHYANPKKWPFGPIYGYYNGKATFTEIMVAKTAFESGSSWNNQLKALPGYHIDHVDIWYEAHGHPGYEVPHYDIHAWYMPGRPYMYWCKNASGKKPAWL